jgi:hypothetical protein
MSRHASASVVGPRHSVTWQGLCERTRRPWRAVSPRGAAGAPGLEGSPALTCTLGVARAASYVAVAVERIRLESKLSCSLGSAPSAPGSRPWRVVVLRTSGYRKGASWPVLRRCHGSRGPSRPLGWAPSRPQSRRAVRRWTHPGLTWLMAGATTARAIPSARWVDLPDCKAVRCATTPGAAESGSPPGAVGASVYPIPRPSPLSSTSVGRPRRSVTTRAPDPSPRAGRVVRLRSSAVTKRLGDAGPDGTACMRAWSSRRQSGIRTPASRRRSRRRWPGRARRAGGANVRAPPHPGYAPGQ